MTYLIVRYLHFLAIFAMFALVTTQHMLAKDRVDSSGMAKLARIDAIYGLSALIVFICGLGMWFWVGKPSTFYSGNWVFHLKITLFVILGLVSIGPTVFFMKARKRQGDEITIPKKIIMMIRVELLLLCLIPLTAVIMATGLGS